MLSAGRGSDRAAMVPLLLVLSPVLLMYDTRLGALAIGVAIVLLYNRRPAR